MVVEVVQPLPGLSVDSVLSVVVAGRAEARPVCCFAGLNQRLRRGARSNKQADGVLVAAAAEPLAGFSTVAVEHHRPNPTL